MRHVHKARGRDRALSPDEIRAFLKAFKSNIRRQFKIGLHLILLTIVRKSELLLARWEHVDLEQAEWHIPAEHSKTGKPCIVFVSRRAVALFREPRALAGGSELVMPGRGSLTKPFAHNAINTALKTALQAQDIPAFTIHDLRCTASTLMHEKGWPSDVVEKALNHAIGGVRGGRAQDNEDAGAGDRGVDLPHPLDAGRNAFRRGRLRLASCARACRRQRCTVAPASLRARRTGASHAPSFQSRRGRRVRAPRIGQRRAALARLAGIRPSSAGPGPAPATRSYERRRAVTANTAVLREWLRQQRGVDLADYEALRRWSVEHVADFWQAMWDFFDLRSPTPYAAVLADARMPGARWFAGAQLNFAQQVLRHVAAGEAAHVPAIVFRNERLQREGRSVTLSWPALADQVGAFAATLRALGVQPGERVAAHLPNIPQAAVAFLACASIGAIWSVTAPDMGVATVCDRFAQIEPKVLIAVDGTVYGGKVLDRRDAVAQMLQRLPSVQALVRVPYLDEAGAAGGPFPMAPRGFSGRVIDWAEALATTDRVAPQSLPFDQPLWIVYSSGTTGLPKPIVHGHGGVVIEQLKMLAFHLDLRPSAKPIAGGGYADSGERFCWYSSTGWVMWNVAVAALLHGVTTCLYDGHPSSPDPAALWRFAAEVRLSFLGAGAAYYAACLKAGLSPRATLDLGALRSLGSTGSPLAPEAMQWGFDQVRHDIWWAVISGGTDFAGAFLGGTPELPTVPGQMQARCLGADVQSWNEAGEPLIDAVGELVCTQPLPSMPLYFWGDADGRRYREAYFDMYPGVWRHGDWLKITTAGGAIIYGRSDATLNRHGHRMGTAELYQIVEALPQVVDSLVVDIEVLGRPPFMPLFVVLRPGTSLDAALDAEIRQRIRDALSPRFVPDEIVQVAEVPRTLTGKKQELPVKKLLLGRALAEVVNRDACANPASFDWYVDYARRRLPGA